MPPSCDGVRVWLFPWAPFRHTKAAVKLHTLLDLHGNIAAFIHLSDGKLHDLKVLDMLPAGSDRGIDVRPGRYHPQTTEARTGPLHNSTDPEPHHIRENANQLVL